jgi:hypothetical protein
MRYAYTAVGKAERKRQLEKRIILKEMLKKLSGRMWTEFVWLEKRDQWRVLVYAIMNFRVQ